MTDVFLVVGGVVALAVILRALGLLLGRFRRSETLDFSGPIQLLEVAVGAGEVTVRGSRREGARVRRVVRRGLVRPRMEETLDDGVLRLQVRDGIVHYQVDVPHHTAVDVRGGAASATVIGMAGPVRLRASSGSLEGRALTAPEVRVSTRAGSVRLSFDQPPDMVDVATTAGSVDLALPDGPYDVDAQGAPGQTRVGVPVAHDGRRRITARCHSGSVRIHSR